MSPRSSLALATAVAVSLLSANAVGDPAEVTPSSPTVDAPAPEGGVVAPTPDAPPPVVIGGAGYLHLRSWARVLTDGGSDLRLPPGYYLDEENYKKLDVEVHRLQDVETRYFAENGALKSSLDGWQPGWRTLVVTLTVGFVGGLYVASKF